MPKLVPMTRGKEEANGGPLAADVHPAEVANYERGGWRVADAAPEQAPPPPNPLAEKAKLIKAAATAEALDKLAGGETNQGLLKAIAKRRKELGGK